MVRETHNLLPQEANYLDHHIKYQLLPQNHMLFNISRKINFQSHGTLAAAKFLSKFTSTQCAGDVESVISCQWTDVHIHKKCLTIKLIADPTNLMF